MSPDLFSNDRCYNTKADLWSLGVITYQLLIGDPPFDGLSVNSVIFQIKDEFKKLYFGHENKLYSILKSIYHLSKDEIDYGYTLLNQITLPIISELHSSNLIIYLYRFCFLSAEKASKVI